MAYQWNLLTMHVEAIHCCTFCYLFEVMLRILSNVPYFPLSCFALLAPVLACNVCSMTFLNQMGVSRKWPCWKALSLPASFLLSVSLACSVGGYRERVRRGQLPFAPTLQTNIIHSAPWLPRTLTYFL